MRGKILDIDEKQKSGIISTDRERFTFNFNDIKSPPSELQKGVEVDFECNDTDSAKNIYIMLPPQNINIPFYEDQEKGFASLFSAKGCYTRWQYWKISLISIAIYLFLGFIAGLLSPLLQNKSYADEMFGLYAILVIIIVLPLIYINIVTSIKRFHDINLSGWFYLLNLIPYLGGLITFIMNGFITTSLEHNRFCRRKNKIK
jgi:uncharacterized membrane protein YhaH (DUF805 family)